MFSTVAFLQDVGGGEMLVIAIVALLIFGRDLPNVSRKVGKALAEFKKNVSDASSQIQHEMDAAAREVDDTLKEPKKDLSSTTSQIQQELTAVAREVENAVKEPLSPPPSGPAAYPSVDATQPRQLLPTPTTALPTETVTSEPLKPLPPPETPNDKSAPDEIVSPAG
jgi:sec-independent protein translocase protein TatA